jgi:RHS repeat-associated protein
MSECNNERCPCARVHHGREWDSKTNLYYYYYRARYYDPATGRFVSEDPIGFAAGTDFYDYVLNNSPTLVDPEGLAAAASPAVAPSAPRPFLVPKPAPPSVGEQVIGTLTGILSKGAAVVGIILTSPVELNHDEIEWAQQLKCKPRNKNSEADCWQMYQTDVATCRRVKSAACYELAMQRYAACRAGRPIPEFPYRRPN